MATRLSPSSGVGQPSFQCNQVYIKEGTGVIEVGTKGKVKIENIMCAR